MTTDKQITLEMVALSAIHPYARNAKKHPNYQIEQMKQLLIQLGYAPTNEMALALVVLQKALNGDMKAFSQIQQILNQNVPTGKDD